jgi:hypothetical protein
METTIQIKNVKIDVKEKAEKRVKEAGFSSLQDVIRLMVIDISKGRFPLTMSWSVANDAELTKALDDFKNGRYKTANTAKGLDSILDEALTDE